jgi:signal transduction histidine kinase
MQIILFFYLLELNVFLLESAGDSERTKSGEKNIIF